MLMVGWLRKQVVDSQIKVGSFANLTRVTEKSEMKVAAEFKLVYRKIQIIPMGITCEIMRSAADKNEGNG
jgi:hypothetical protein